MLRTIKALIDEQGNVSLSEPVHLQGQRQALVTILDEEAEPLNEVAILAETALAEGWSGPEEDEAWRHLGDLPDLDEGKP
jgi:hypothetical protein